MRIIIHTRPDGGVSVVRPVISNNDPEGFTEAQAEQRAWDRMPPDAITPQFSEISALPADRSQRAAWRQNGATITIDSTAAAAISAEAARRADDAAEQVAAKANGPVMAFLNMTKAQSDAWIDANVSDPGTRTALKVLGAIAKHAARGKILR